VNQRRFVFLTRRLGGLFRAPELSPVSDLRYRGSPYLANFSSEKGNPHS
jgi:hypothetical protein